MATFTQQMVDQIFSYGELGFQEQETHRYLVDLLKKNGFTVEEGIAGIPTAFMASWGSGKPVISLGSDIDGIPQSSQKPGVAYRDPLIEGGPGHGEGHNSGQAVNITAAIAVKKIMEREKLPGHDPDLAGHRRRAARHQGALRPRRLLQGCRRRVVRARLERAGGVVGRPRRHRPRVGRVLVPRRDRALRRGAVARKERARRGRADEHRLELPARAPAARAPLALRDHPRRRSAQRRPGHRLGLVLLPPDDLPEDHGPLEDRRRHGQGRGADDGHRAPADARARHRLAAALQPHRRGDRLGQHPEGRHADVERGRSDAGEGAAEGARLARDRGSRRRFRRSCKGRSPTIAAAARTTSATCRGTSRRSRCAIRPTSPACPATTGPTPSRWRRRSRTRAAPPAPRCRR